MADSNDVLVGVAVARPKLGLLDEGINAALQLVQVRSGKARLDVVFDNSQLLKDSSRLLLGTMT
jgi:hypothetical protein